MAEVYDKETCARIISELKESIFIYPTDTVYGIGCKADDVELVTRIREIKGRNEKPLSVIAPSKDWIREHCIIGKLQEEWLEKLPGPFTLILKLKKKGSFHTILTNPESLGVRIPDHWFTKTLQELGVPFVTTSANLTGEDPMTSLRDLDPALENDVDFIIDDGPLRGHESTIMDLTGDEPARVR